MTEPKFHTHREAELANWFSRRHETNGPHREAQENYRLNHSKKAKQRRAIERMK